MKNKFNIGDVIFCIAVSERWDDNSIVGEITSINKEENGIFYKINDQSRMREDFCYDISDWSDGIKKSEQYFRKMQEDELYSYKKRQEEEWLAYEERKRKIIAKIKVLQNNK